MDEYIVQNQVKLIYSVRSQDDDHPWEVKTGMEKMWGFWNAVMVFSCGVFFFNLDIGYMGSGAYFRFFFFFHLFVFQVYSEGRSSRRVLQLDEKSILLFEEDPWEAEFESLWQRKATRFADIVDRGLRNKDGEATGKKFQAWAIVWMV